MSVVVGNETINGLLRGELAAVETYKQALAKLGDAPGALELRRIEAEHRQAVHLLRQQLKRRDGAPDTNSGAWGVWASAVEGTAKLLGNAVALKALKQGEEYGAASYEKALEDENLDDECKMLLTSTLLPQTRAHVPILEKLIAAQQ